MTRTSLPLSIFVVFCVGCAGAESPPPPASGSGGSAPIGTGGTFDGTGGSFDGTGGSSTGSGGNSGSGGSAAAVNPLGRARCTPPPGMTGTPQTIEDAVAFLNALPKPTSVACFVEALDRPLGVYATNSMLSLQPAVSNQSPRVFLKVANMWLSVVIDGPGDDLIEFGELIGDGMRSLKGELKLPVTDAIAPTVPFDRVLYSNGGTTCGLCHRQEIVDHMEGTSQIFSSVAFRPEPTTRVKLDSLRAQWTSCDWQAQPDRCDLLSSIFGGGDVVDAEFPSNMTTFLSTALPGS